MGPTSPGGQRESRAGRSATGRVGPGELAAVGEKKGGGREQNPPWDGLETTSSGADTIFPGQLLLAEGPPRA